MNVEGGFSLIALFDGTTLNAVLDVEGAPLLQFYTEGTKNYTPDFSTMTEQEQPTVKLIMRNISTGDVLVPKAGNVIKWKYNGVVLTFGDNGMCTTDGMIDMFQKIDNKSTTIDGQPYDVPALRIKKNLVPISGFDNDRISVEGTIEVNGQNIPFKEVSTMVQIRKAATNAHIVVISDDNAGAISVNHPTLKVTATLYKDTSLVTDIDASYKFQWVKLLGTEDQPFKTGQTITVTKNDVDNVLKLRCDVSYKGKHLASGFHQIQDVTDPYYVDFKIEGDGVVGNALHAGQTAMVTPIICSRNPESSTPTIEGKMWNWNLRDNKGQPFILAPHDSASFAAKNISIAYNVLMHQAGGGMSGSVSTTV